MSSYIFHIHFILFIYLQNTNLIFDFICLTLSLANTHGIAKYARTYIQRYTHTHTQKKKVERVKKRGKEKKKRGGVREERNNRKGNGQNENKGEKIQKEETERKRVGGGKGKTQKEGGRWDQGVRGAWVLRRVGPHTNNARST